MESAARQEDAAALQDGHAPLVALYRKSSEAISSFCAEADAPPPDYSGVMEFMPEE